ncbi:MAG: hypothetical protein KUL77_06095 [Thermomonas sp.]|uniref:hypothetical protein n=1 Tax=Thermomonas sp. TaxID=1971895 RepID=UPI001EBBB895|nr:hypothetical protein [Thermomonas sp.]MBV2209116.1 hypothetical protein [Thermomonas sp.]
MSDNRSVGQARKARFSRIIKVAPMTRAVRSVLAVSAMTLALGATGQASAAPQRVSIPYALQLQQAAIDFAPVFDLTIIPSGAVPLSVNLPPVATAGTVTDVGDITIDNADPVTEIALGAYDAIALGGYSSAGGVDITNQAGGALDAQSEYGMAIGIYAYSYHGAGDVRVHNAGDITAYSSDGLADGIFAYGADVDVNTSGTIDVTGSTWATGIEAQGTGAVTVTNTGDITATADPFDQLVDEEGTIVSESKGGTGFGIYVTAGEAQTNIDNSGDIAVTGGKTTGIQVQSYGSITVTNNGDIVSGTGQTSEYVDVGGGAYNVHYQGTFYATGINAVSGGTGAVVNVENNGNITAQGTYNGVGISAVASGEGGQAHVSNSGDLYVTQAMKYGTGAYGITVSADGDASIDNSGAITSMSRGAATGLSAASFAGDVTVTNSGDVMAGTNAMKYYGATGIVAFAGYGSATVDNSGSIYTIARLEASTGINAQGFSGATVNNSGYIYAYGEGKAYGIYASSGTGDVVVTNQADGEIKFFAYGGSGFGVLGIATQGDVSIDNAGMVHGYAYGQSSGAFAVAMAGNASINNSGTVDVTSGGSAGAGLFARADYGDATIDNSGIVNVKAVETAYGAFARSGEGSVTVDNSGTIDVYSYNGAALGIRASSSQGDVSVTNSGTVDAFSYNNVAYGILATGKTAEVTNSGGVVADGIYAFGVRAGGYYGATVTTTDISNIQVFAVVDGAGVRANAYEGDATIVNGGYVAVSTRNGYADGLVATSAGGNASVSNTGDILVASIYGRADGIVSYALTYNASITNSGSIAAYSRQGEAKGLNGYSVYGNVEIENSGYVVANSPGSSAIAIYGYSLNGDVHIANTGDLYVESYNGLADGIFASGANVAVENAGAIKTIGAYWSAGIEAQGAETAIVSNDGAITSVATPWLQLEDSSGIIGGYAGGKGFGIYATSGEGGTQVTNTGAIAVDGGYAFGIEAQSYGNIVINNSGDITAGSGLSVDDTSYPGYYLFYGTQVATGIHATTGGEGAAISVTNSGNIAVDTIFGGSGIEVASSGIGGTAVVSNSGDITVEQYVRSGTGANGIVVSADANAGVSTSGTITVTSGNGVFFDGVIGGSVYGAMALSFAGNATAINNGDITVSNDATSGYVATGITAFAGYGDAAVGNYGSVIAASGYYAKAIEAKGFGDVTVVNGGELYAHSLQYAFGIYAQAGTGDLVVANKEDASIGFYSWARSGFGILGVATQGDVSISNAGTIEGYAYGQASGIFANAQQGDVSIGNSGSIDATSGNDTGVGVFARADNGTATVVNSGDITATSGTDSYPGNTAFGILARGDYAQAANSGAIVVNSRVYATGIAASSKSGTTVSNSGGSIYVTAPGAVVADAYGYYSIVGSATGIDARSAYGDVNLSNASEITALSIGGTVGGISALAGQDLNVINSGDITAGTIYGEAFGISANDQPSTDGYYVPGTTIVQNSGDILLEASYAGFGKAMGISANRKYGDVTVENSGDITIYAGGRSYGVFAYTNEGDVNLVNTGDIKMLSYTDAMIGLAAQTGSFFAGGGNATLKNSGDLSIHSDFGIAVGLQAIAGSVMDPHGDSYILNTGDLDVSSQYMAYAIQTRASMGNATIINTGNVTVDSAAYTGDPYTPGTAAGISALTFSGGDITLKNGGNVTAHGYVHSFGLYAKSENDGNVAITNSGDVSATSDYGLARGVFAYSFYGDVVVNNAANGDIEASGGSAAMGIHTATYNGDVTVNNAGKIHASGGLANAAILFENVYGTNTLNNLGSGVIGADGTVAYAVVSGDSVETINNAGTVNGSVTLGGGDDAFNNLSGGLWDIGSTTSTDFGDGNDSITNAAGGTIRLAGGSLTLGAGDNTFTNSGLIEVLGAGNLIHMGTGPGVTLVPALNATPFVNNGIIDFQDGDTNDALTIEGNMSGTGQIAIDLDLANNASDLLFVNGDMAAGAVQTVNVVITQMPISMTTQAVTFAHVEGTSAAGNFVGGTLIGYSPSNFMDLKVVTKSTLDATNGSDDLFAVALDVAGLNDTGTLSASAASGAAAALNAQVGTFRQRLGANPYGDADKVMSGFVRFYSNDGDMALTNTAGNFGQAGNFGFNQRTWGNEFGINANLYSHLHAGVVLGKATSRQRLTAGAGENRFDGTTVGLYASWYNPTGLYVDLSSRWMTSDLRATSAAGVMDSCANAHATSLEAGYTWQVGGFNLVPQLQYTYTKVDGINSFHGTLANFDAHGATSSQGRAGLAFNKAIESGGVRFTPYGAVSAVREFVGKSSYTVADVFYGHTSSKGTSALAELGLGIQKGGFGLDLGVNWMDGGAYKSVVGGQANIRYSW